MASQSLSIQNKKKPFIKRLLSQWQLYALLTPAMFAMLLFHYVPMYGVIIAFKEILPGESLFGGTWVGFENFKRLFKSDLFSTIFKNTIIISFVQHFLLWPLPIIFALLIHNSSRRSVRKFSQTATYLPHLLSTVVVVTIIELFCNRETGLINIVLQRMGFDTVFFQGDPKWFYPMYFLSGIWTGLGSSAVIYIAALSSVDTQLIEAALMDGANKLQRMWYIDIPTIMPTVVLLLIMDMGKVISVGYEKVLLMQNDLNLSATEIIGTYVYKNGLINADYSFSTAVSLFTNIIGLALVLISNRIAKRFSDISLF
ncbi:MAG: ABC transporter permease subunit [Clostridia bacterium]|nr:ABC transporter permease subunit [Clostridia bacterium]